MNNHSNLLAIPSEILEHHIFSFLSPTFLIHVCELVSKEWLRSVLNTSLILNNTRKILNVDEWNCFVSSLGKFNRLKELQINTASNYWLQEHVETFKNSKYLKSLAYSGNLNSVTVGYFGQIKNLKVLKLFGNEEVFVTCLQNLLNLERLEVSGVVQNIEDLALLPNFKTLVIYSSQLCSLDEFASLSNLQEIAFLSRTTRCYSDIQLKGLSKFTTNLTKIEICKHLIGSVGARYISQLKGLTHLDISFGDIGVLGAKNLSKLTNLQTLILTFDCIENGVQDLIDNLPRLTHLDLTRNYLFDIHIGNISNLKNLTHLVLDINRISSLEEISKLEKLQCLKMDRNHIYNVEPLIGMKYLKILSLSDNYTMPKTKIGLGLGIVSSNIGDEGAKLLVNIPSLTELHLDGANLTQEGKQLLSNQKHLKILSMWESEDKC